MKDREKAILWLILENKRLIENLKSSEAVIEGLKRTNRALDRNTSIATVDNIFEFQVGLEVYLEKRFSDDKKLVYMVSEINREEGTMKLKPSSDCTPVTKTAWHER